MKRPATRVVTPQQKEDAAKIASAIQGVGRPVDVPELAKLTKLNGTRVNAALPYARSLGVTETYTDGELLPRYGFDLFGAGQSKVKAKKSKMIPAKVSKKTLLETIKDNPNSSLDTLAAELGKPPLEILPELTKLELSGEITERGGRYNLKVINAPKPKAPTARAASKIGSKIKARAGKYKNIISTQTCSTVRRDADTGRIVPTCDTIKEPEKFSLEGGISGTIEFKCDGSGQPAIVKVRSVTEPELRKALREAKTDDERAQIEAYRTQLKGLVRDELQTLFDRDRLEDATREDEAKVKVKTADTVLGVTDFDYAALDLGNIDKRTDAQSLERAVNKYRGSSMKIRFIKKRPKAFGRGAMPFTDKVVNRYFDQDELEFLGGTRGAQGGDRAVTQLERKR